MRKYFLKVSAIILSLILLCSCADSSILKTEEIKNDITQTTVITDSKIKDIDDFSIFLKNFKEGFTIPGLLEGIIPQGICYDETTDCFLISGYYEKELYPSMVIAVDSKTNKFVGAYSLKNLDGEDYFGHAGGIAASQNTVYITSGGDCYSFPASDLKATPNGSDIQFKSKFKLNTKGSFAAIHDNILWAGDFVESKDNEREKASKITTLSSGETFYAYCEGYILKDGLPQINKINSKSNGYIPDYMLAIPEQVQGIAFTKADKIVFSTSFGRKNNSRILVYNDVFMKEKSGTYEIDGKSIDLIACSNEDLNKEIVAPPMSEGIGNYSEGICLLFESGAAKYRRNGGKYPVDTVFTADIE